MAVEFSVRKWINTPQRAFLALAMALYFLAGVLPAFTTTPQLKGVGQSFYGFYLLVCGIFSDAAPPPALGDAPSGLFTWGGTIAWLANPCFFLAFGAQVFSQRDSLTPRRKVESKTLAVVASLAALVLSIGCFGVGRLDGAHSFEFRSIEIVDASIGAYLWVLSLAVLAAAILASRMPNRRAASAAAAAVLAAGAGAALKADDAPGRWLLHAARNGDAAAVETLTSLGVDPNKADHGGMTALMWACAEGRAGAASALIAKGADVDAKFLGRSALDIARQRGRPEIAALLETRASRLR